MGAQCAQSLTEAEQDAQLLPVEKLTREEEQTWSPEGERPDHCCHFTDGK